jgi:regulatory protein
LQSKVREMTLTKEQALQKLKHYCRYQERCHSEVKEKLYSLGLFKKDVEILICQLIEEDYLNEERFAKMFTGGKFRIKQWGRIKIKYELKQKKISEYCIKKALQEIEETEYKKALRKLAFAKWKTLHPEKNIYTKKSKTINYMMQKGYEPNLINEVLTSFLSKK